MTKAVACTWGAVVLAHVMIAASFVAATHVTRPATPVMVRLSAHIVETNNPALADRTAPLSIADRTVLEDFSEHLEAIPPLPTVVLASDNGSAIRTAPRLLDGAQPATLPFARRAGLLKGESAFVVLRVQVLIAGAIGEVAIDVSSGSRQVDEAAREYARQTRWIPGRMGTLEETTWVRMGVRLAA